MFFPDPIQLRTVINQIYIISHGSEHFFSYNLRKTWTWTWTGTWKNSLHFTGKPCDPFWNWHKWKEKSNCSFGMTKLGIGSTNAGKVKHLKEVSDSVRNWLEFTETNKNSSSLSALVALLRKVGIWGPARFCRALGAKDFYAGCRSLNPKTAAIRSHETAMQHQACSY